MFHRRDILKAALTAAALPALKLPAFAKPPRRFIDIHCHFSNAADLPIRGFLQRVVMSDYSAGQAQTLAGSISLSVWKGLAARLADTILKYETPTSQKELACLSAAKACPGFGASISQMRGAARALKSGLPVPDVARVIADVLAEHYKSRAPQPKSNPSSEFGGGSTSGGGASNGERQGDRDEDTDAFADFVLKEMEKAGAGVPGTSSRSLKSLGSSLSNTAGAIGSYLASGRSTFSRYFAWAELLTNYRETIIETYYSLYDPQHTRLILTAPAIVDYNYWLQDYSPSPLKDQVELLSALSLRQPQPMHGFVAFDPLREIRSTPNRAIGARHRPRGGDEARLPGRETLFAHGLQAHGQCRARRHLPRLCFHERAGLRRRPR